MVRLGVELQAFYGDPTANSHSVEASMKRLADLLQDLLHIPEYLVPNPICNELAQKISQKCRNAG